MPKRDNKWFWLILGIVIGLIIGILLANLFNKQIGLGPEDITEECSYSCNGDYLIKSCYYYDGTGDVQGPISATTKCPSGCEIGKTGNAHCSLRLS